MIVKAILGQLGLTGLFVLRRLVAARCSRNVKGDIFEYILKTCVLTGISFME
jgi:hypothetical protein